MTKLPRAQIRNCLDLQISEECVKQKSKALKSWIKPVIKDLLDLKIIDCLRECRIS